MKLTELADSLLEAFSYYNINKIPIGNEKFRKGIKNLGTTLKSISPNDYNHLTLEFMPDWLTGDYSKIEEAICHSNFAHLESPFDEVSIRVPSPIKRPTNLYESLLESFCFGAGLKK
jgi:hypothetical protein